MLTKNEADSNYPQKLDVIAQKVKESIIAENDDIYILLNEEANKSPSLMARLFPTALQKEKQHIVLKRSQNLAAEKEKLIDLYFKVKLEQARIEGETLIKATGVYLKTELTFFVTTKIDEMDTAILASRERVMAKMKPHIDTIEQYKDYPMLYEPAKQSIQNQIVSYMGTIEQLLDDFRNSLRSETQRINQSF